MTMPSNIKRAAAALIAAAFSTIAAAAAVNQVPFGQTDDGKPISVYTLSNANGMQARVMTYGAVLVSLTAPDRAGHMANVVLGFDKADGYVKKNTYFGATIGRYANRIGNATFTLDDVSYQLPKNAGPNTLHGGEGFHRRLWSAETVDDTAVRFSYVSADGEEGFPGRLTVYVTYRLRDDNALVIDYEAVSDKPTVAAFTNHSFFNLSGDLHHAVTDETLAVVAGRFTPVDATAVPTGEVRSVEGTPYDFRVATTVGSRLGSAKDQLQNYDINFVLEKTAPSALSSAAMLSDPLSGRMMEVLTTEPGIQLYTANNLKAPFVPFGALCLETQHFPDSPNKPNFPPTVLRPGQVLRSETVYLFRTAP